MRYFHIDCLDYTYFYDIDTINVKSHDLISAQTTYTINKLNNLPLPPLEFLMCLIPFNGKWLLPTHCQALLAPGLPLYEIYDTPQKWATDLLACIQKVKDSVKAKQSILTDKDKQLLNFRSTFLLMKSYAPPSKNKYRPPNLPQFRPIYGVPMLCYNETRDETGKLVGYSNPVISKQYSTFSATSLSPYIKRNTYYSLSNISLKYKFYTNNFSFKFPSYSLMKQFNIFSFKLPYK